MVKPAEFVDDPLWYSFLPELTEGTCPRSLPAHEDCSPIDLEAVASHLYAGGTLGRMPGYEERSGQIAMARNIALAFNNREHLMIEAGTGVGKSLAYLIPSILWAWTNDTPVVISTATRNLQSQLIQSDIPRALQILGENASLFRVALLKGRSNYLCLRAVSEFFAPGYWTMSPAEQKELPNFIEWLHSTPDGDLDTYDGLPRSLLTSSGEECGVRHCPYYRRCFVYHARQRAARAHLIIANHTLVLIEANSGNNAIIPAYGRLVLDEAHNLESIATEELSSEFSMAVLQHCLNRLMRPGRSRGRQQGILANIQRQLQKNILKDKVQEAEIARILSEFPAAEKRAIRQMEALLEYTRGLFAPVKTRQVRFVRRPEGRSYSVGRAFRQYDAEAFDEAVLKDYQNRFENSIAEIVQLINELLAIFDELQQNGEPSSFGSSSYKLLSLKTSLTSFLNHMVFIYSADKDNYVYWAERIEGKRGARVRLTAAPLSVGDRLNDLFYKENDSVILSSATLRVGRDFSYMAKHLGCGERFHNLVAESPFDYFRQALVLAPDFFPELSEWTPERGYDEAAQFLRTIFREMKGRGLVLFTNNEMMKNLATIAAPLFAEAGLELLMQGAELSREHMTRRLKSAEEGHGVVLFGSQSFWEGVDVAGEALSCVVIVRLPFLQAGDPIVEARTERIDQNGGSGFRDYYLPEAVIKFRQGFGRLIRTKHDKGVVIVMDPRLVKKNYGAIFRNSLPATVHKVSSTDEVLSRIRDFMN